MERSFNSGSRSGVFLCSGRKGDFNATGEMGQPVYSVATTLREAIRRFSKTQPPLAHFLAIPQPDESGEQIDWYADPEISDSASGGATIVNWNNATDHEKAVARPKLLAFEKSVNEFSAQLLLKNPDGRGDKHTFAKLLPKVLITPSRLVEAKEKSSDHHVLDPSYVYLVGPKQQPVLAFWGFSHPQVTSTEPFHFLQSPAVVPPVPAIPVTPVNTVPVAAPVAATAAIPPAVAPVVAAKKGVDIWRILRWLALLLLLLLSLFFLWRSCTPSMPRTPGMPNIGMSVPNMDGSFQGKFAGLNLPQWLGFLPKFGGSSESGVGGQRNLASPNMGAGFSSPEFPDVDVNGSQSPATSGLMAQETNTSDAQFDPVMPDITSDPSGQPPALPDTDVTMPPVATPVSPAGLANATGTNPPAVQLGPELHIPPELSTQAVPSYLNGQWQVHALQDEQTGRPVRLEYDIRDGHGQVQIHQGNGVSCQGPVQAVGQGSGVRLNSAAEAHCDDGSSYQMPEVECRVNASQHTECSGRYDGNPAFPISVRQASE